MMVCNYLTRFLHNNIDFDKITPQNGQTKFDLNPGKESTYHARFN
jgi:hypothetical protein